MSKKLVVICLAASIGFAPIVFVPMAAMALSDAPAAASSDASLKLAKAKKVKKVKKVMGVDSIGDLSAGSKGHS